MFAATYMLYRPGAMSILCEAPEAYMCCFSPPVAEYMKMLTSSMSLSAIALVVCSCSDSTSSMTDTSFPSLGSDVEGCSHPESPGSRSPVRMIFAICFMVLKFKNYRRRAFHPHCASVPHNPIVASLSWSERAVLVFELRRFEVIWSLLCLRAGSISSFATRRICRCN